MIVVLDVNIVISAIISGRSSANRLLIGAEDGHFDLVVSPLLLAELSDVLGRAKFRRYVEDAEVPSVVAAFSGLGRLVSDPPAERGLTRDPDDDYLVSLARSVGADLLVTGDKDLLDAGLVRRTVVTPRDAVERLSS